MVSSISDGARLMRASFDLVRRRRRLLLFPAMSTACLAVTAGFWIYEGAWLYAIDSAWFLYVPVVVLGLYSLTVVGIFFNVALAGAAADAIDGSKPSLGDAINVAWLRFGAIATWAAYAVFVSLVLGLVKSVRGLRWAGTAAQIAWNFATIFVVPLIALEGEGASSARKHSFSLAKENWRAESGGLGALRVALIVPMLLFYVDFRVLASGHVHSFAGRALLGAILLAGFGVAVAASVVRQVFAVELYRAAKT
ncbi:MAG: DUF6159 family protein [Gaiellaceae bacterium]